MRERSQGRRMRLFRWLIWVLLCTSSVLLVLAPIWLTNSMLLLKSNCLANWSGCSCSWKGGKFVADCVNQGLLQVPKNDYYDYLLANAGNNQMPTLNRDIQQLNLASNNITTLKRAEFYRKKFRNLQKIYLNANQITQVASSAFYKLTGLIELDLSENMISKLSDDNDSKGEENGDSETNEADQDAKGDSFATTATKNLQSQATNRSFLSDLAQLRQLNLASNQLEKLDKFTFSPLTQLRQLILSRNQISHIDKQAFDGLNVLNILHLDGNKLHHLDGDIFTRLPQLYGLQLAGGNPWRCDCHLRKLVRNLLRQPASDSAQHSATKILQDEPQCMTGPAFDDPNETNSGEEGPPKDIGRSGTKALWQNMRLGQFECPPELIDALLPRRRRIDENSPTVIAATATMAPMNIVNGKVMNMNDKSRPPATTTEVVHFETRLVAPWEPMELTIAASMTDELDLELVQVEWLQLDQLLKPSQTLWRSIDQFQWPPSGSKTNGSVQYNTSSISTGTGSQEQTKDTIKRRPQLQPQSPPPLKKLRQDYAIIDYVTRVNRSIASETNHDRKQEEGNEKEAEGGNGERLIGRQANTSLSGGRSPGDGTKLIRVVHFVMDAATTMPQPNQANTSSVVQEQQQLEPLDRNFLCRITNLAGRLEVVFTVRVDQSTSSQDAQNEWHRRKSTRDQLAQELASSQALAKWLPKAAGWSLERAKATLAAAEKPVQPVSNERIAPLFVPLYLPDELVRKSSTHLSDWPPTKLEELQVGDSEEILAITPVARIQNQRPATRQTANGSLALTSPTNQSSIDDQTRFIQGGRLAQGSSALVPIAQSLIARYTSNKRSLIEPFTMMQDQPELNDNQTPSDRIQTSLYQNNSSPLASIVHNIRMRYLDRWIQLAISGAPLLLGLSAGLIVGCLLTVVLVLRYQCATNRVRQTSEDKRKSIHSKNGIVTLDPESLDDDDDESPNTVRFITGQQPQQLTSAGSSSSTTNGSQRRLIRNHTNTTNTSRGTKNKNLVASNPSACLDSSCQSDDGELDADVEDSIDSQAVGLKPGFNWTMNAQLQSSTSSSTKDNIDTNATMTDRHRLIVVSPQQEMQELLVAGPSSLYLTTVEGPYGARYISEQASDADSSLITYHCGATDGHDNSVTNIKTNVTHTGVYSASPNQLSYHNEFDVSQSSSLAVNNSLNSQAQHFIPMIDHQKANQSTRAAKKIVGQDLHNSIQDATNDKLSSRVYQISGHMRPGLGNTYRPNNEQFSQLYENNLASPIGTHQFTSSSSVTSNSPSQSIQVQINQRHPQHQNLYLQCTDLQEQPQDLMLQNPNIVYLEDALQLLHSSMNDCLVLRDNNNDLQ